MNRVVLEMLGKNVGQQQGTSEHDGEKQILKELLQPGRESSLQPGLFWSVSNAWYLQRKIAASRDEIRQAVEMNIRVMHGNPVFRGTRVPLYQIVEELADGTTLSEIVQGYPSLTITQVQRGLDFAASLLRIYDDQIPD